MSHWLLRFGFCSMPVRNGAFHTSVHHLTVTCATQIRTTLHCAYCFLWNCWRVLLFAAFIPCGMQLMIGNCRELAGPTVTSTMPSVVLFNVKKRNHRGKVQERKMIIDEELQMLRTKTPEDRLRREIPLYFLCELNFETSAEFPNVAVLRWQKRAPTAHSTYYLIFDSAEQRLHFASVIVKVCASATGFKPKGNYMDHLPKDSAQVSTEECACDADGDAQAPTSPTPAGMEEEAEAGSGDELYELVAEGFGSEDSQLCIVVLGASGDLAKKKIYPVLWNLYAKSRIPRSTLFIGYARSQMSHDDLVKRLKPYLKAQAGEEALLDSFCDALEYVSGTYDEPESYAGLDTYIERRVVESGKKFSNRVFYLALPPSVFKPVTTNLKAKCMTKEGWTRVIVEKPFGKDSESFKQLKLHLDSLFTEDQLFRIDHYLGKEMVQNLLVLRFSNAFLSPLWSARDIKMVLITMKEPFGTQGRGGYFDEFGIIRDVMQNHLLQVLTLVAMEKPLRQDADAIRDEKVKCLRYIKPLTAKDVILGQYVANPIEGVEESSRGYLDDETVPAGSKTPTFATAVFYINNDRWEGVPFVIKCGKALNEKKAEIRVQFKDPPSLFEEAPRNELIMRIQPNEAVYMKMCVKQPGMTFDVEQAELDLNYNSRFSEADNPDAYERLVLDAIRGSAINFVRTDELEEAWRIFTPLLKEIDAGVIEPVPYKFGSRGPESADKMIEDLGYTYTRSKWAKQV
eukprot:m.116164 g.116164  ORF g.116164 m.116164 type:complete len:739 (-) comp13597_c3_seq1:346-2562(-)